MNLVMRLLYCLSCQMPIALVFALLNINTSMWYVNFIISGALLIFGILIIVFVFPKIEKMPVTIGEFSRLGYGSIATNSLSFIGLVAEFLPAISNSLKMQMQVFYGSLLLQTLISIATSIILVDPLLLLRGYRYSNIKINGTEYMIVVPKNVRDRTTIKYVKVLFDGLVFACK